MADYQELLNIQSLEKLFAAHTPALLESDNTVKEVFFSPFTTVNKIENSDPQNIFTLIARTQKPSDEFPVWTAELFQFDDKKRWLFEIKAGISNWVNKGDFSIRYTGSEPTEKSDKLEIKEIGLDRGGKYLRLDFPYNLAIGTGKRRIALHLGLDSINKEQIKRQIEEFQKQYNRECHSKPFFFGLEYYPQTNLFAFQVSRWARYTADHFVLPARISVNLK
jgi:hypothetical protein